MNTNVQNRFTLPSRTRVRGVPLAGGLIRACRSFTHWTCNIKQAIILDNHQLHDGTLRTTELIQTENNHI